MNLSAVLILWIYFRKRGTVAPFPLAVLLVALASHVLAVRFWKAFAPY